MRHLSFSAILDHNLHCWCIFLYLHTMNSTGVLWWSLRGSPSHTSMLTSQCCNIHVVLHTLTVATLCPLISTHVPHSRCAFISDHYGLHSWITWPRPFLFSRGLMMCLLYDVIPWDFVIIWLWLAPLYDIIPLYDVIPLYDIIPPWITWYVTPSREECSSFADSAFEDSGRESNDSAETQSSTSGALHGNISKSHRIRRRPPPQHNQAIQRCALSFFFIFWKLLLLYKRWSAEKICLKNLAIPKEGLPATLKYRKYITLSYSWYLQLYLAKNNPSFGMTATKV